MPNLKNSRGKFFETHNMPRDRSFWYYFLEWAGRLQELPAHDIERLSSWKPERSNCPELTVVMEDFTQIIPPEWRNLADSIFVGRVLDGATNAKAWTMVKAGIIEINIQYTIVLSAYVAAFDEYIRSVRDLLYGLVEDRDNVERIVDRLDDRLSRPWYHLEESRPQWMDVRLLAGGSPALLQATPPDRVELREDAVLACEEFAVAHELAHHLLGHTTSSSKKAKAKAVVDAAVSSGSLMDQMAKLNQSQTQELEADILAFVMMADAINKTAPFTRLYRALVGGIISLVALAHVNDAWIDTSQNPSHPNFIVRCTAISALIEWLAESRPRGAHGDHPLGLLTQLLGFSGVALNAWLHRSLASEVERVTISSVANHILKLAEEYESKIPKDPRFGITI